MDFGPELLALIDKRFSEANQRVDDLRSEVAPGFSLD